MSAKRFIPISESVLSIAVKVAERVGTPLREFIERVLAEVLRSMQYRSDILEVLALSDLMDDLRRIGGALLPFSIVKLVIDQMDDTTYNQLLNEIRRMASWYGMLVKVKRGTDIDVIKLVLSVWFPDTNVSITSDEEGNNHLVISSPNYSIRLTNLVLAVIEELCRSFGINIISTSLSQGVVKVVMGLGSPKNVSS